jgi:Flp pilus assembly protein TadG
MQKALDRIARYLATTQITDGKDGNIAQIRAVAKDFDAIRQSFKGVYKDLQDEQQSKVRGGQGLAYDS